MFSYLEEDDSWDKTSAELLARGVPVMNFYDIIFDYLLLDSFDDLDLVPGSLTTILNNSWLTQNFKQNVSFTQ